jgi:hypothetical protein
MLPSKLRLYECDNVEGICRSVLDRSRVPERDREDALAFLISSAWELSERYERGDGPSRFGYHLKTRLPFKLVDWQRKRYGRTTWKFSGHAYERPRVDLVSLDADGDSLGAALAADGGDFADGRYECESGLELERDRQRVRDLALLGLAPDR